MTDKQMVAANAIYEVLTSQRFANFYGAVEIEDKAPMSRHITGDDGCLNGLEILQEIVKVFRIPA
jgi:hypothetical protein